MTFNRIIRRRLFLIPAVLFAISAARRLGSDQSIFIIFN